MGHHWVPQYYQRGFTDPEKPDCIWVYDKDNGPPSRLPIKRVAQAKQFYTATVEQALADEVEGRANPVLDKLRSQKPIDDRERMLLSVYMQVMIYRVPGREKLAKAAVPSAMDRAFARVDRMLVDAAARDLSKAPLVEARRAEARRLRAEWEKELPKDVQRQIRQPEVRPRIVDILYATTWIAKVAPEGAAFLTSDDPVFYDRGLGLGKSDFIFPLSTKIALWGTRVKGFAEGYFPSTPQDVTYINQLTIMGATRYVFHSRGDLLWPPPADLITPLTQMEHPIYRGQ